MIYCCLLAFFFVEYVRPTSYLPALHVLRLNSLLPLLLVLGTLMSKSRTTNRDVAVESNTWILLSLLGMIGLSVLTARVTIYAYNVFISVFGYILIYWVIVRHVTTVDRVKGVFKMLIFIHALLALMTPEMFTDGDVRHYMASGAFLSDGNDYALSVNIVIPFCLFLLFDTSKGRTKMFYGLTLLFLTLCVVATKSRGGTLALGCLAAYYWWKSDRKMQTGALAAAAVVLIFALSPPKYFERMRTISAYEEDGSAQGRINAWKAGFNMALDHPILGVGAGHFPANVPRYQPGADGGGRWKTAHSIYFLLLGELGFPGILLLLYYISSNLLANRRLAKDLDQTATRENQLLVSMSAGLIAYASAGAFLSAAYYPHLFVIAGLSVAIRRIIRERLEALPVKPLPSPTRFRPPTMLAGPAAARGG